eukprot:CAMPEP_0183379456 /NCGR_PEP_ID=MMETSP0164_2-20130417/125431_1 /TAXON_ID=221442 /ORGANISM="Coccolithus pelagicus ssp braarudi, Strain PLY182g" /LENGTH=137 /DNA_ID=CAMNT_0025557039 /DNA_START=511 /DNA_END=924 /DNA_ORIENTATION=+
MRTVGLLLAICGAVAGFEAGVVRQLSRSAITTDSSCSHSLAPLTAGLDKCLASAGAVLARPTRPRLASAALMKSKEDLEFEEWARKKKIAAGVDPDENFGEGRRVENSIYLVGGLITVLVPVIAGTWAYQQGYLTPQ